MHTPWGVGTCTCDLLILFTSTCLPISQIPRHCDQPHNNCVTVPSHLSQKSLASGELWGSRQGTEGWLVLYRWLCVAMSHLQSLKSVPWPSRRAVYFLPLDLLFLTIRPTWLSLLYQALHDWLLPTKHEAANTKHPTHIGKHKATISSRLIGGFGITGVEVMKGNQS